MLTVVELRTSSSSVVLRSALSFVARFVGLIVVEAVVGDISVGCVGDLYTACGKIIVEMREGSYWLAQPQKPCF